MRQLLKRELAVPQRDNSCRRDGGRDGNVFPCDESGALRAACEDGQLPATAETFRSRSLEYASSSTTSCLSNMVRSVSVPMRRWAGQFLCIQSGARDEIGYDALDHLIATTDPLNDIRAFSYNSRGWKLSETDPSGNTTLFGYDRSPC